MKKEPIFIREITDEERTVLEKGLRATDACQMKRSQILLASSRGLTTTGIVKQLGYSAEYARQLIHRFNAVGIECLKRKSSAPKNPATLLTEATCERVKELLHRSPREHGQERSIWTLTLVAQVLYEKGETPRAVSAEAIRLALLKNGTSWKRAKDWIQSPDPNYQLKKTSGGG